MYQLLYLGISASYTFNRRKVESLLL